MDDLRQRITDLMPVARDELAELVALRSVADPRQYPAEECERTAQWVLERFAGIGFSDARLEETTDGSMAVVGSRKCSRADAPTVFEAEPSDVQERVDQERDVRLLGCLVELGKRGERLAEII